MRPWILSGYIKEFDQEVSKIWMLRSFVYWSGFHPTANIRIAGDPLPTFKLGNSYFDKLCNPFAFFR
mgnify:CR=1 FL=1